MQDMHKTDSKYKGRWTKQEHLKFLQGLRIYGKNWKKIEQLIQSRTGSQIRSHAQKFFLKNSTGQTFDDNELCHFSGENQEQHEQITGNSKSIREGIVRRQDLSYYLVKIVEYSSGRTDLDFWGKLVDCKGTADNSNQPNRKNSFTNFGDQNGSPSHQEMEHKKVIV